MFLAHFLTAEAREDVAARSFITAHLAVKRVRALQRAQWRDVRRRRRGAGPTLPSALRFSRASR